MQSPFGEHHFLQGVFMWKLINRHEANKQYTHYVFVRGDEVAIADHSIYDMNDPSTTDDGLLLWDGKVGTVSRLSLIHI